MSVLIRTRKVSEDKHAVYAYHANPEKLDEEEKKNGIMVESLPEKPETEPNQKTQLFFNPEDEKLWYEVTEKQGRQDQEPLTDFQKKVLSKLDKIEQRIEELE